MINKHRIPIFDRIGLNSENVYLGCARGLSGLPTLELQLIIIFFCNDDSVHETFPPPFPFHSVFPFVCSA